MGTVAQPSLEGLQEQHRKGPRRCYEIIHLAGAAPPPPHDNPFPASIFNHPFILFPSPSSQTPSPLPPLPTPSNHSLLRPLTLITSPPRPTPPGEYAERIDNADELLETFLETFPEETAPVQLQLLTATVKLFLKKPTEVRGAVTRRGGEGGAGVASRVRVCSFRRAGLACAFA